MKELSLWIYASTKLSCILLGRTNATRYQNIDREEEIRCNKHNALSTPTMTMYCEKYVTEQIRENRTRICSSRPRRREPAVPKNENDGVAHTRCCRETAVS